MKTTFIFDTKLYTKNGKEYYARTLHYELWRDRYIKYFGEINVSTREAYIKNEEDIKQIMNMVNGEDVSINPIKSYKKIPDSLLKHKIIKKELKEQINNSDFVIVRMPSILGILAIHICKEINKKFLVEVVADPWDSYYYHTNILGKLIAPFMYFKTKVIVKNATNVLYVTETFLQNRYPSLGENLIGISDVILPNATSDEDILTNVEKREKNILKKEIIFGIVGNYDLKTKGQHIAIKALSEIDEIDFVLELVGSGDTKYLRKKSVKGHIDNRVVFSGTKKASEMTNWYDSIDVLLVPSFQEGLPRVVIEAMNRGVLVIGSTAGGISELIDSKYVFKKGDYVQLKKIILNLANSECKVLQEDMKKNIKKAKTFRYEELSEKRNQYYERILDITSKE